MEKREWVVIANGEHQLFGMLHLPDGTSCPPLVVFLHGFASNKYGTGRCYVTLAEELSRAGIASLRFDFRGSGDSEGSLANTSFEDLVSDAVTVLRHTQKLEMIDQRRVGLFGSSLGGTVGVLAAKECGFIQAMVLWSPIASGELWVRDFLAQSPEYMKQDPRALLATYRGVPLSQSFREQFARMGAAKVIEELPQIPLLHMQGENDETVSLLHQQVYKMHCEGRVAPSKFLSFPDTAHSLGRSTVFPVVAKESVLWLSTHLNTHKAPEKEVFC
jgi:pimeloyl-ACP methyl ester carboxylesterase